MCVGRAFAAACPGPQSLLLLLATAYCRLRVPWKLSVGLHCGLSGLLCFQSTEEGGCI